MVVSAPSGVGKTSLISRVIADDSSVSVAISHTTRPPRSSEINKQHYHFVSNQAFDELNRAGGFVETAKVFGFYYGVSWDALEVARRTSKLVILEIDWQGARSIRVRGIPCRSVFILPPTKEAQMDRLMKRDQDSSDVIRRRLRQTHDDCRHYSEFDYQIINDDFDRALLQLKAICSATKRREKTELPNVSSIAERLIFDLKQSLN